MRILPFQSARTPPGMPVVPIPPYPKEIDASRNHGMATEWPIVSANGVLYRSSSGRKTKQNTTTTPPTGSVYDGTESMARSVSPCGFFTAIFANRCCEFRLREYFFVHSRFATHGANGTPQDTLTGRKWQMKPDSKGQQTNGTMD